eukprot:SAG31_NODE_11730_length_1002_cov_1.479513_2_plen_25_part_01
MQKYQPPMHGGAAQLTPATVRELMI